MANTGSTTPQTRQTDAAHGEAVDARTDAGGPGASELSRKSRKRPRGSGRRSRSAENAKSDIQTTAKASQPQSTAGLADALHFQSTSFLCSPQTVSSANDPLSGWFASDTSAQFSDSTEPFGPTASPSHDTPRTTADDDAGELLAELRAIRESLLQEVRTQFNSLRDDQDEAFQTHETLVRRTWQRIRRQFRTGSEVLPAVASATPAPEKPPVPASPPKPAKPLPTAAAPDGNRSWEQIRRDFLDACDEEQEAVDATAVDDVKPIDPADALLSEIKALNSSVSGAAGQQTYEEHLPDMEAIRQRMADSLNQILDSIPTPVDTSELDEQQMRDELLQRDEYIARMVRACRQVEEHRAPLLTMEQMQALAHHMPQDSREVYQQAVARIQELNRMSEMEMSFERARLVRERIILQRVRQHLESSAGQLGMVLNEDGTLSRSEDGTVQPGNLRWLRKLGLAQRS